LTFMWRLRIWRCRSTVCRRNRC